MLTDSEIKSILTLRSNYVDALNASYKTKTFADANNARIRVYQTNKDFTDYLESLRWKPNENNRNNT